jgi:hypothetical protein
LEGCCECGDEPSGSGSAELVSYGEYYSKGKQEIDRAKYLCLITITVQSLLLCEICVMTFSDHSASNIPYFNNKFRRTEVCL